MRSRISARSTRRLVAGPTSRGIPLSHPVNSGFDVVRQDAGAAGGDFVSVVRAIGVGDDGDQMSGAVADAWLAQRRLVLAESRLARAARRRGG